MANMRETIRRFLKRDRGTNKRFSAWQVELTTRCPLQCKMCIRAESADWHPGDMRLEDFRKILPYLKDVETVVLEGWGESLLHKDLLECVRLVKGQGSTVGFVTSAKGLNEKRVSELVAAGLDFVGFSIAGTTPEVHDAIRVSSKLSEVISAIQLFNQEKARLGINRPRMHLILLMLKQNILDVPSLPSFAREVGIEEVNLTNICHSMTAWQEAQGVFTWTGEESEYEQIVKQAEASASKLNVRLRRPLLAASDVAVCEENPLATLYISVDGEVSPCVYLNPPLSSPFKRIFCGEEQWVERVSFGNIFKEDFSAIWSRAGYVRFRECFVQRKKVYQERYGWLYGKGDLRKPEEGPLPEPPEPCKTCHKMLGV
jgi:MoaA/NifB/PqqE/SkfB family radical SAM enzyme